MIGNDTLEAPTMKEEKKVWLGYVSEPYEQAWAWVVSDSRDDAKEAILSKAEQRNRGSLSGAWEDISDEWSIYIGTHNKIHVRKVEYV